MGTNDEPNTLHNSLYHPRIESNPGTHSGIPANSFKVVCVQSFRRATPGSQYIIRVYALRTILTYCLPAYYHSESTDCNKNPSQSISGGPIRTRPSSNHSPKPLTTLYHPRIESNPGTDSGIPANSFKGVSAPSIRRGNVSSGANKCNNNRL
ncbi:hypothetical protein CDAR_18871 [Caerostris darwini]|uniref:Uncharacterized protein n=1 Tax=Caerostris darwini TaxID=1538125 RepID=A0AAV4WCY1_9ARAC|nr:hypothetical protein CDAR_18871 [Caerostris darwini]